MVDLEDGRIVIDIDEKMNPKNADDVLDELSNAYDRIQKYKNNFGRCSCCDSYFDLMDKNSQSTEDGRLCAECHETYTITYDQEQWGAVGVTYTETGEWVSPCPSWL